MVEDSPMQIRAIMSYFELTSYQVECAQRLADAIGRVQQNGIDAILLDLALPDSHGRDTFRQMQAAAQNVPIVILTSNDDEELALQLLRDGAQDYLIKGEVTSSWVQRALRYAIERSTAAHRRAQPSVAVAEVQPNVRVDTRDDVTVVRIQDARLADSLLVDRLATKLFRLVDEVARKKFLLDCAAVDYISNSALGQLLQWDQKIRKQGGKLRVFGLRPEVKDQMKVRKLLAQFDVCLDEETARSGI